MNTRKVQHFSPEHHPQKDGFQYTQETFVPELPASNEDQELLKKNDFELQHYLNTRQINTRFNILAIFIPISLKQLVLTPKTIDIGIRLFDYYYLQKIKIRGKQNSSKNKALKTKMRIQGRFLQNKEASKTVLVVCLFLAAKYNQIYPPGINDFLYVLQDNLSRSDELQLQRQILMTTGSGFNNSTMYDWFTLISNKKFPQWALMNYCHSLSKAQRLARAVHHVCKKERDEAINTSNAKLSRTLAILGIKKEKPRRIANQSNTPIKPKQEQNHSTNLSDEERHKLNDAVKEGKEGRQKKEKKLE